MKESKIFEELLKIGNFLNLSLRRDSYNYQRKFIQITSNRSLEKNTLKQIIEVADKNKANLVLRPNGIIEISV